MHELWVCSNKCCNRYKPGYAEAVEWMKTQPPFKLLKTTIAGYRLCNHCGADNSWVDRACPGCGTRFGMLEPDDSDDEEQKPIEILKKSPSDDALMAEMMARASLHNQPALVPSDAIMMAEMMKAALMRDLPALSANAPLLPMPPMLDVQPADELASQLAHDNDANDQDDPPQCEVCEWYNPRGIAQCERCTAFLPFMG